MSSSAASLPQQHLSSQEELVSALASNLSSSANANGTALIETHISWVLLSGSYAYKIKKALKLDFLDFSTLERRRYYCEEEIRLNRRLAPQIYLDVVPIGGTADAPEFGRTPVIEWAVRMARFDVNDEMDSRLHRGALLPKHVDSLALVLARFHINLPPSRAEDDFGDPHGVRGSTMQNLAELGELLTEAGDKAELAMLERAIDAEGRKRHASFDRRLREGCVRECHGDLHLANIVLIGEESVPFDGIEFDPELRWIDVMADLAFPYMDLIRHGRSDLAHRLLTLYLEQTGDYGGVEVLPFYASSRAAVRAKVNALRAQQSAAGTDGSEDGIAACRSYIGVARQILDAHNPALIITCGLPGSGKSTFALAAAERLGAIRIRSDIERKRLFGLSPLETSLERVGDIYGVEAGARTYESLRNISGKLLAAGFIVVVDAAFLKQSERDSFRLLAESLGVPFVIASVQASEAMLQARIMQRLRQGGDPSEADLAVLKLLQSVHEQLIPAESVYAAEFINDGENGFASDDSAWKRIEQLLSIRN